MRVTRALFVACGAALLGAGALVACNAVLGIDEASPEPKPTSSSDGGGALDAALGDAGAFVAQDDCADYCHDMAISCGAMENQEYLSADVCNQLCTFHANHYDEQGLNGPVDVSPTSAVAGGDSIYCRVWHSHAALANPEEHCPHAGPLGAETCGTSPCDDFCSMAIKFCPTSYPGATPMADCMQACGADAGYAGYPYLMGDASDLQSGGNTLNCRMYHLENFLFTGDAVHCSHITPDGGGVCVN
jgi:hypothetical protein